MTAWETVRLSALLREIDDRGHPDLEVLSVYRDLGVVPKASRDDNFNKTPQDLNSYKRVRAGDLVVNKMKAWSGSLAISDFDGIVSGDYMVCAVMGSVERRFLHHLLRSRPVFSQIAALSTGIRPTQWRLYWDDLRQVVLQLPPPAVQTIIATYLDAGTARIDTLLFSIHRQVELIQEHRQRAAWLTLRRGVRDGGAAEDQETTDAPVHWRRTSLRRIANMKAGESITADAIEESGTYPVYGGNGLRGYAAGYTHRGDFILVGRQGALCGNVNYANGVFWASEHAVVVEPGDGIHLRWLGELLRSMDLNQLSQSAAQPGLSVDVILSQPVAVPPLEEQREIADAVDRMNARADALIGLRDRQARLLVERRQALITAAVTGQLDIPGVAA